MIFLHSLTAAAATGLIAYAVFYHVSRRQWLLYKCAIERAASAELALRRNHTVVKPLVGMVATAEMSIEQRAVVTFPEAFPKWAYEADQAAREHFARYYPAKAEEPAP